MANSIWIPVSGASAQERVVDTVANNLANAETTAFKKDQITFEEYLVKAKDGYDSVPRAPVKNKDLFPLDGKDKSMVAVSGSYTDFSQGPIEVTHSHMHFAIEGPGFFEILTPRGVLYSRSGNFKLSASGHLVTSEGFPVLARKSAAPAADSATDPRPEDRTIVGRTASGSFTLPAAEDLSIVSFRNLSLLRKVGAGLYAHVGDASDVVETSDGTSVLQGALERSNVNTIQEMTNLIKAHRSYEANINVVESISSLPSGEIGKLK